MRYLRAISGVKLRDRVRNEAVRTALQMNTTITDIIKTKRLKLFGHVARRPVDSYVARATLADRAMSVLRVSKAPVLPTFYGMGVWSYVSFSYLYKIMFRHEIIN